MSRLKFLVKLAQKEIKPVSQIMSESKKDIEFIKKHKLDVLVETIGCGKRITFGKPKFLGKYLSAHSVRDRGLVFGYPVCCSEYFERFMEGKEKEIPKKHPPLEHFVCPSCKESEKLKKRYEKEKSRL